MKQEEHDEETEILEFYDWKESNRIIVQWFEVHRNAILALLKTKDYADSVIDVQLMGSRAWDLSYPESDIDATIIATDHHGEIISCVKNFLKRWYDTDVEGECRVESFKTFAGLPLIVADKIKCPTFPDGMKLEYIIQTKEQYDLIVKNAKKGVKEMSLAAKSKYTHLMREFYKTRDEEGKRKLKAWLKCLPEEEEKKTS